MSQTTVSSNRLIRRIQTLARMQYAMAAAALMAIVLFYGAAYRPQQTRIADLDRQTSAKQLELASARMQTDRLPQVTLELQALRHRLAGFKKLPDDPQYGQFIREINQASERASLSKLVVQPGTARREELFSEQPIVLTFQGDFAQVWGFIRELEDMERLTRLRDLSISTINSHDGTVDVKLSVNIYYAPVAAPDEGKTPGAVGS
jgi:Tfp pilus assembly protein PilO